MLVKSIEQEIPHCKKKEREERAVKARGEGGYPGVDLQDSSGQKRGGCVGTGLGRGCLSAA